MRMITAFRRLGWAFAACFTLAACENGTEPVDPVDVAGAEAIAGFLADSDIPNGAVRVGSGAGTYTYTRSTPCPGGGTQSSTGSTTNTVNATTNVLSSTWTTTQTHDKCAFTHTRGGETVKTTIDGKLTTTGSSTTQRSTDRSAPAKLLSFTSTTKGSTTTTIGQNTRVCDMDFTNTYDPATNSYTTKGVVCGQQVTITRTPGVRTRG